MNIGEASSRSGVSAKMIRYYEQIGLMPPSIRGDNTYRRYRGEDVHMLRFIRRARDLGFSIEQIRRLVSLWQDHSRVSAEVKEIAMEHIGDLEKRIREMEAMVETLRHLASHCHGDHRPHCPILEDLAGEAAEPTVYQ